MGTARSYEVTKLDYGDGFEYRLCCDEPWCGLGDLLYKGTMLQENVTQAEARRFQKAVAPLYPA